MTAVAQSLNGTASGSRNDATSAVASGAPRQRRGAGLKREASAVVAGQSLEGNAFGFQGEVATTALLFASAAEEQNMVATCIDAPTCIFRTHAYRYIHLHACRQRVRDGHPCTGASAHTRIQMHTSARL